MEKTKKSLRVISTLLAVLMLFYAIPLAELSAKAPSEAVSEELETEAETYEAQSEEEVDEDAKVLYEIEEMREEDSKYYRLSNGSNAAVRFSEAVHYENPQGEWENIDNTLTENDDSVMGVSGYSNTEANVKYTFSDDISSEKLVACSKDDYAISFSYEKDSKTELISNTFSGKAMKRALANIQDIDIINPSESTEEAVLLANEESDSEKTTMTLEEAYDAMKTDSSVKYVNVERGVDIRYDIIGDSLKEYIILSEKPASYKFNFSLETKGLEAKLCDDGSVSLCNEDGEEIFSIPAPVMYDNADSVSHDASYSIVKTEDGYSFSINADVDWIKSDDREYPIIIDPALTVTKYGSSYNTDIVTGYYSKRNAQLHDYGTGIVYMGYDSSSDGEYVSYMKVNNLPVLPDNCIPVMGLMYLGQGAFDNVVMNSLTVSAHKATGTAWYTAGGHSSDVLDYTELSSSTTGKYVYWNVTSAMQDWYDDSSSNKGVVFKSEESFTNTNCAKASFVGYNNANFAPNSQPKFVVYYRNTVGIESYYTYHTQEIARAGTGYVRDLDAAFTLVHNDVSNSSEAMGFTLSHIYNSVYYNRNFTSTENTSASTQNTLDYSQMKIGRGWKLNIQQTIKQNNMTDASGNTAYYKIYTDEDGTEHYFYHESSTGLYKDEDGLGLKIIVDSDTHKLIMSDDKDNKKIFWNGYLHQIIDANGNTITIKYGNGTSNLVVGDGKPSSSQNRIVQVTQQNNGSKTEKIIAKLMYNSNKYLEYVLDENEKCTTFSIGSEYRINSIEHPDAATAYYYYGGTNYRMSSAFDGESGYGVYYNYNNERVSSFFEYADTVGGYTGSSARETGAKYYVAASHRGVTYVRDTGPDRQNGGMYAYDDIVTTYLFDDFGRTVNSYSSNKLPTDTYSSLNTIYGTSSAAYTPTTTSTPKKNNRIANEALTGGVANNLLINPGAESLLNNWGKSDSSVYVTSNNSDATLSHTGEYSFVVDFLYNDRCLYQQRSMPDSTTYTFSAYVKTDMRSCSDGGGVWIDVVCNNEVVESSRIISRTTNSFADNGWDRLSVTFEATAGTWYMFRIKSAGASGKAYVDDVQLEYGSGASRANLVDNGRFESGSLGWTYHSGTVEYSSADHLSGTKSLALTSKAGSDSITKKVINIYSDSAASTYVLSGWGKANAIPYKESSAGSEKFESKFKLYAKVTHTDNTVKWFEAKFNPEIRNKWQYTSAMIVPDKPVKTIEIGICYGNNNNTAYFDDISLIREDVQTYKYDNDGKLVSVNSSSKEDADSYTYSGANLIKSTSPGSGTYTYEYNNSNNPHLATKVTNDTTWMTASYNSSGQTTTTELHGYTPGSSTVSSDKLVTSASYTNDNDHVSTLIDANGISENYTYSEGKMSQKAVQSSNTTSTGDVYTSYNYNYSDRPSLTFISGKIALTYTYTKGQVSNIRRGGYYTNTTDAYVQNYSFEYDKWGSVTATKINGTSLAGYTYRSGNGNMTRMDYGNGDYISYAYDKFDRVIAVGYNGVSRYVYTYNADGALSQLYDADIQRTTYYVYDGIGRLVRECAYDGSGKLVSEHMYGYDNCGRANKESYATPSLTNDTTISYNNKDGTLAQRYYEYNSHDDQLTYTYDALKRLRSKNLSHHANSDLDLSARYLYANSVNGNSNSSNLVNDLRYVKGNSSVYKWRFNYEYDNVGNIKKTYTGEPGDDSHRTDYYYDTQGQLTVVCDKESNKSYRYMYDTYGNIRYKSVFSSCAPYNSVISAPYIDAEKNVVYTYGDANNRDLLTAYDGVAITYDGIGNPLSYYNGNNYSFTWDKGRKLQKAVTGGKTTSYSYAENGLRSRKYHFSSGDEYKYYYAGDRLVSQTWDNGSKYINFLYDESGSAYGFVYNDGTKSDIYYYIKNLQGDVVYIVNTFINKVAEYRYDAWGRPTAILNGSGVSVTDPNHIANINPIRYRGYYYDTETGFYYLQSRYYDPEVGRFINKDGFVTTGQGFLSYNMFAYCVNNPISFVDYSGDCHGYPNNPNLNSRFSGVRYGYNCGSYGVHVRNPRCEPYKSADDAARAFAEQTYSSSSYIRHEYSTEVYSRTLEGETTYNYNKPRSGEPHSASVGSPTPEGTVMVGYAHTHPNSNSFSQTDIMVAEYLKIDAYVVGPNLQLQKYSLSSMSTINLGIISPIVLTDSQRNALVSDFKISWDAHISAGCDFGCNNMIWPTP